MDFLDKLKGGSGQTPPESTDHTGSSAAGQHDAHPATKHQAEETERGFLDKLIAGTGGVPHTSGDDRHPEKLSLLDKLTHKEDREKKAVALAAREAEIKVELEKVAHDKKANEGFFERIKDKFDGEEGESKAESHPQSNHEDGASGFFDKLTGKEEREKKAAELDKKETELRAELERVQDDIRDNQGLLERLKDRLDGDEEAEAAQAGVDKPSFLDKITGKAAEEERLRKEEENKSALEKMKDKMNEGLGGGRKAEKNEDFLDKSKFDTSLQLRCAHDVLTRIIAIDGFQEHILKKGTQSEESAWEQAKDDKIADLLRSQLNMKDKKEDK